MNKQSTEYKHSLSVAALLYNAKYPGRLILVHRKDVKKWTLPAGGMEEGDFLKNLVREISQETNLKGRITVTEDNYPIVVFNSSPTKASLGIILQVRHSGEIPGQTWSVIDPDGDIDKAAIFKPMDLVNLLENEEKLLYKPDFNRIGILTWIVPQLNNVSRTNTPFLNWFIKNYEKYQGVNCLVKLTGKYECWQYTPKSTSSIGLDHEI